MKDEILNLALEILQTTREEALKNYKSIPEIHAFYFWNPKRGGNAVIVNEDCERLGATSSVSFEKHLDAFKAGKRN